MGAIRSARIEVTGHRSDLGRWRVRVADHRLIDLESAQRVAAKHLAEAELLLAAQSLQVAGQIHQPRIDGNRCNYVDGPENRHRQW